MISIIIIMFCFILGYKKPKSIGWILLSISPILVGIGNLVIYNDIILPVRWEQVMFACSLGIAFSYQYRKRLVDVLFNVWPVFLLCIFIIMEIIYGLIDPHETLFKWFMLQQYPLYFSTIVLSFSLVQSYDELLRFKKIILYSVGIIILLCLFEMMTKFNLSNYLCYMNPANCDITSLHYNYMSESYILSISDTVIRRYAGYTGQPNLTAIILAMYSIFIIHSLFFCKKHFFCINVLFFLLLSICVLVVGQTRAAIFGFALILITYSLFKMKLFKYLIILTFLLFLCYIFIDSLQVYVNLFIEHRLVGTDAYSSNQRLRGMLKSLELFNESFGMGVGGTIYSIVGEYLNNDDTSAYILYFIAGGIPLGMAYLVFLISMPYDLIKIRQKTTFTSHKLLIEMAILAILIGLITQIFNQNAIVFYCILLYATAKSSLFNKKIYHKYNNENN